MIHKFLRLYVLLTFLYFNPCLLLLWPSCNMITIFEDLFLWCALITLYFSIFNYLYSTLFLSCSVCNSSLTSLSIPFCSSWVSSTWILTSVNAATYSFIFYLTMWEFGFLEGLNHLTQSLLAFSLFLTSVQGKLYVSIIFHCTLWRILYALITTWATFSKLLLK